MKLRKFGQAVLAIAVGIGSSFGLTSCVQSHSIGYLYVTGVQYNQVGAYKIDNNTGSLTATGTISSGGTNPVDAIVTQSGKFLYVLNAGCADPTTYPNAKFPCASGESPTASNIALFTIGGNGKITFEASYASNGLNSVSIATDSTGSYLYVLDQNTPTCVPAQYANDGDISIFAINANTGRLSPIVNNQVQATCISSSGTPSTQQIDVFPTGPVPVWFRVFNGYVWTIDRGTNPSASPSFVSVYSSNSTNGQLLATQNSEFPTGARNLVYIGSGGSYLYLVDQGDPGNVNSPLYTGEIYEYTPGANGSLTAVTNGTFIQAANGFPQAVGPTVLTVDSQNKFLYVANGGPNTAVNAPASSISTYFINSGVISPTSGTDVGTINNTTGSGPRCILEDPSNQYLFTANYNDSTITGKILNGEEGAITPLRRNSTATAPGEPTWCVASGNTF